MGVYVNGVKMGGMYLNGVRYNAYLNGVKMFNSAPTNFTASVSNISVTNPAQSTSSSGTASASATVTLSAAGADTYKVFSDSALTAEVASGSLASGSAAWTWSWNMSVSSSNVTQTRYFVAYKGSAATAAIARTMTITPNRSSSSVPSTQETIETVTAEYTYTTGVYSAYLPNGQVGWGYGIAVTPKTTAGTLTYPAKNTANERSLTVVDGINGLATVGLCQTTEGSTAIVFQSNQALTSSVIGTPPLIDTVYGTATLRFMITTVIGTTYTTYYNWNCVAAVS
jgi:hypothetical protein